MTVLTSDEAVLAFLRQAKEPAEIRDAAGNFVGVFTPARSPALYPTTRATEADLAEIDKLRATEKDGQPLRDVFMHMRTLTTNADAITDLDRHIRELDEGR